MYADEVVAVEPVFAPVKEKTAGAVYSPTDASGSAEVFTRRRAEVCERLGVSFRLGTHVRALRAEGDRVNGAVTDAETVQADVYLLALGVGSPRVARTIAVKLPIYAAKGYSINYVH